MAYLQNRALAHSSSESVPNEQSALAASNSCLPPNINVVGI
jgi:hypothetical protein